MACALRGLATQGRFAVASVHRVMGVAPARKKCESDPSLGVLRPHTMTVNEGSDAEPDAPAGAPQPKGFRNHHTALNGQNDYHDKASHTPCPLNLCVMVIAESVKGRF